MEDLNDILAFVRVAELDSFTEAAKAIGATKSMVSRRVARLERALNARLLQRSTRHVGLTDVGRRYFERCRSLIQDFDAAGSMVAGFQSEPIGLVRVTAPVILGQAFLAPIVTSYLARFPRTQCLLELSNRRVDLIEEGFDLALRVGDLPDSSLRQRSVGAVATGLYASPGYLERNGMPAHPLKLSGHSLLELASRDVSLAWRLETKGRQQEIAVTSRLICSDVAILRKAAENGLGIARLPTFEIGTKSKTLVRVLPRWRSRTMPVTMLFPSHKSLAPNVRAFMDIIVQELKIPAVDA